MKKRILFITILALFLSCKEDKEKTNFIGNWSTTSDTSLDIDIMFTNELILIDNPVVLYDSIYTTKWTVIGKKIELEETVWDYKLNYTKDTLLIKHETDSVYIGKFKKIENAYEYFENKIGFSIDLKRSDDKLISLPYNEYAINIYVGMKNNKLIARTDYSKSLDNLIVETFRFSNEISKKEESRMKYVLFIDKKISKKQIDSIKSFIDTDILDKIFTVHSYKENEWNEQLEWLGKFE